MAIVGDALRVCSVHSVGAYVATCPSMPPNACHQCGGILPPAPRDCLDNGAVRFCDDACADAWDLAHLDYWNELGVT